MQFYLNGSNPGDPDILAAAPDVESRSRDFPDAVDVLIVGNGPAGTVLAAQLSSFPGISTRIVEQRNGPLQLGQADGVACRTVEMFEAFGLGARLLREAYWVNETVFWRPSQQDRSRIVRTGRVQDTEDGLSEFRHVNREPGAHAAVPARIHAEIADATRARLRHPVRQPRSPPGGRVSGRGQAA